ncbi:hypothetical protein [Methylobacter marinus]|uniref:hypothetical protein n=1 Tax=Methylobacter marinus TaxID=34058 RepID=UPI0003727690|nr:hypothetical protein [Methylobacter marinus]
MLDVDNTLLDNDRVIIDLRRYLEHSFGFENSERYWAIFEQRRAHRRIESGGRERMVRSAPAWDGREDIYVYAGEQTIL